MVKLSVGYIDGALSGGIDDIIGLKGLGGIKVGIY